MPVFYHVEPKDIRDPNGSFKEAFANHLQKYGAEKVVGWKAAFIEAGFIIGSEPEHVEKTIQDVIEKLSCISPSVTEKLVGIDKQKEKIKSLLHIDGKDIRIIGIWGMNGIGKTTLAEAVYNEVSAQFETCCFLPNVRENSKTDSGILSQRNSLLSQILKESLRIDTPRIGSTLTRDRLQQKRVLVVLDDVSDLDQLKILDVTDGHLGSGSRIILTSTDKQVLMNFGVENDGIYEVKKLDYGALRVLGSSVYNKSEKVWESALIDIKEHLDPKIDDFLKISLDGLGGV
ncbi:hypothetical protein CRYUN_Cryun20dG0122600 [Craigia yunnanensis]